MVLVNFVVESNEACLIVCRHHHLKSQPSRSVLERHDITLHILAVPAVKDIGTLPATVIRTLVRVFHARNLTDDVHLLLHGSNISPGCPLLHKKQFFLFSEKSENWRRSMLGENYLEFLNPVAITKSTESMTTSFTTKSKTYLAFIRNLILPGNIFFSSSLIQLFTCGHMTNYSLTSKPRFDITLCLVFEGLGQTVLTLKDYRSVHMIMNKSSELPLTTHITLVSNNSIFRRHFFFLEFRVPRYRTTFTFL